MKTIYFDNNATTCIAPEVKEAIEPFLAERYFNPSSMYPTGAQIAKIIKRSRHEVASLFGLIEPCQIFFTSCATESNNWAIFGTASANRQRRHIVTTAVEHPAVLEVCKQLNRDGFDVTFLPVNRQGQLSIESYVQALRKDTLLVSIMHANNETGVIFPIAKLARIAKATNPSIIFHTDATQTVGKIPIDLTTELKDVDMLSFSGHKVHAPKGIGGLYLKRGTPCKPFMLGGHQESGLRAGTENVPYIVGLAKACSLASKELAQEATVSSLRNLLQEKLKERIPFLEVNGEEADRIPNTLNLACHCIEGEAMLFQLAEHGICASSGSACTSGSLEPSHVLRAMQVPFAAMHGSIRFSLSRYNSQEEVETVAEIFPQIVSNLRRISPYWDEIKQEPKNLRNL